MKIRWIVHRSVTPLVDNDGPTIAGNRFTIWHHMASLDQTHCRQSIPDREFCQATEAATSDRMCMICFPYTHAQQPAAKRKRKG